MGSCMLGRNIVATGFLLQGVPVMLLNTYYKSTFIIIIARPQSLKLVPAYLNKRKSPWKHAKHPA